MNTMPNFFIVGTARSGTTSLYQYLRQHPEIFMAPNKETHYFAATQFPFCKGPGDENMNRKIIRDEAQYSKLFANVGGEKAIGEASAFYLCFNGTAERIAHAVPDAKIIIILREPVARAHSAYMFLIRDGRERLGFTESLSLEEERKQHDFEPMWWYKELSLYYKQVKRYLDVFGPQHVKVLLYDELLSNPKSVLNDIFTFLGVKEDVAIDTSLRYNSSGVPKMRSFYTILEKFANNPSPMGKRIKSLVPLQLQASLGAKTLSMMVEPVPFDAQILTQFKGYFAEDVGRLEDLLDRDLSCWRTSSP